MGAKQKPITKEIPRGMRGKQVTGGWGGGVSRRDVGWNIFTHFEKKRKLPRVIPVYLLLFVSVWYLLF